MTAHEMRDLIDRLEGHLAWMQDFGPDGTLKDDLREVIDGAALKQMLKRGKDIQKISAIGRALAMGETLPPKYKDHALSGDLAGLRDCHIENDWVLLYFYTTTGELVLTLPTPALTPTCSSLSFPIHVSSSF